MQLDSSIKKFFRGGVHETTPLRVHENNDIVYSEQKIANKIIHDKL